MKPELDDTLQAPSDPARTATLAGSASEPSSPGLQAGQQLGHFRIERRLGVGGMGEVYLATDLALDRPVAVKVLPEHLARDPGRRDRLVREARAQARITHPHVGHIYFIGEDQNRLYFAMEFVAGKTLAERIAEGPMGVDEALAAIRAAVLGLREAQRSGFLHRDVKPSNLMIDHHGMLKVLDFGLAAGGAAETAHEGPVAQTSLAGTPLYMSPEQARGEALDLRSDIYALGATLYHLVSGKPPFQAESVQELVTMHASANRPTLPRQKKQARTRLAAIDGLCSRMMAAKPEDRFGSYDELLKAVEMVSITHTRPGGFWARGIAGFVDFMIISFLNALLLAGTSFVFGTAPDGDATQFSVFALYYFLATAGWGRTLGKAVFELEVVDATTGARPRPGRVARRTLLMFGPMIAGSLAAYWFENEGPGFAHAIALAIEVAWAIACLFLLLHASARRPGKRALWDRSSRAMVRYRTPPAPTM